MTIIKNMNIYDEKLIKVCSACYAASCWYGEFMCDKAGAASTVIKTIKELKELQLEHHSYWGDQKLTDIYGMLPDFSREYAKQNQ